MTHPSQDNHTHCFCMVISIYEGGQQIQGQPPRPSFEAKDHSCCFCGATKDNKAKFVIVEGHGILRHDHVWYKNRDKKD